MSKFSRDSIKEFPFEGRFYYKKNSGDDYLPVYEEVDRYKGAVDIQKSGVSLSAGLQESNYVIYFRAPKDAKGNYILSVRETDIFDGVMMGKQINGTVLKVYGSQKGYVSVYIKDVDISNE